MSLAAAPPGETENLAELENLNEETLLTELKVRFTKNTIYTYVGEILVTVNPFKWIPGIYEQQQQAMYMKIGDKKAVPPHLFATSDTAFQNMVNGNENQVCVISGESGAGKTEAAKLFVKHLITVSNGTEFEGLEKKLVQVNPLLEAFGNAQTLMNDNSSRFGKFTEVRFNRQGAIKGAVMRQYLLEKSRVVSQGEGEQNFHVFYIFFAGLTDSDRQRFELQDPSEHRLVFSNDDAISRIKSTKIKEMHKELMECLDVVGFTPEQREDMFSILAGLLHLGDVDMEGEDESKIVSQNLSSVCNQLGLDETAVELALTKSVNIIRGEETERAYKKFEAEDCRDAAIKAIYEALFTWIFNQCNNLLGPKEKTPNPEDTTIGILDIFGFECFKTNSFEQLCINLANEQLQFFFNNHIFAMELAEYAKEGITGKNITYENNQPVLDLILQNKPLGLLAIVDEEALVPKGTDSSMIQKFHAAFSKLKDYERPRGNDDVFTLKHYAGKVTYDGTGFLEKNRDTLAVDVIGALRLSENALLKDLFGGNEEGKKASGKKLGPAARRRLDRGESKKNMRMSMKKARASLSKKKKATVATLFKQSLGDLMLQLNSAAPHFIRCVKPNMAKLPNQFDHDLVLKQLRYTGMLETTRIRREGYSYRPTFADFVKRYYMLGFQLRAQPPASSAACATILQKAGVDGYEVGKTKVFLRYFHVDELNNKLQPIGKAALTLTRTARGITARAKTKKLLAAKRAQDQQVSNFLLFTEKHGAGVHDVVYSLCEEDGRRPKDFWVVKKAEPPLPDRAYLKDPKTGKKTDTVTRKGMQRAASVRWFKEVEKKKGAGQTDSGFAEWFFGVITRKESEDRLEGKPTGTFLIRVAESRFGYSLSMSFNGRIKHFMIDQDANGSYVVVGNDRVFPSLNDIVNHHKRNPVTDEGDILTVPCKVDGARQDLDELEE